MLTMLSGAKSGSQKFRKLLRSPRLPFRPLKATAFAAMLTEAEKQRDAVLARATHVALGKRGNGLRRQNGGP
ncbi:hypothetical protein EMEDMD4_1190022 [Sinorhizobium medicae]|uniref:Uncharacterized protein n=1 Tax=Sinorhizobium medicae TaxID=110321 RepID=A0A508WQA8_9HYPH|nr:hypothetical protein EMEDMD4_1190022 [Sinorhizobium medicae]